MANYLVASGSRKISQLEIATNPIPENSSSVMPMVIGDTFPITNGTTVQITPNDFLNTLVWNASNVYTQSNQFRGDNEFSGSNRFTGSINLDDSFLNADFLTPAGELYNTTLRGGMVAVGDFNNPALITAIRMRATNGQGFVIEDAITAPGVPAVTSSILSVGPLGGDVQIHRETHFSEDVYITGSLRVQEIFYVFETASILNSSGSTNFGDTGDDTHKFSGSILLSGSLDIIDGQTLDGVDLSVFSASVQIESQSFAARVTENSQSLSLLSSSYENFSGSQYKFDSGSFSSDITENSQSLSLLSSSYENFSGSQYKFDSGSFSADITENSQSLSLLSSSYENFSGSQYNTDSSSFSSDITENSQSLSLLSSSYENFSGSQYNTDSSSFSADITENSQSLSLLSSSYENFSGSQYNTDSGSVSTRITDLESFSSSLDNTYATDVELATVSQSFETDIDNLSGSISTRFTGNETDISNLQTDSGSFSTRVTTNETDISNLKTDSGSFSTRVTTNETDISNLQTDSGSFSTRVTTNEGDISNLQTDSGSFSTRVTTNETDISNLQTDSGSFSTRITTNENDISNLQTDSGSFSTRVTDQESFSSSFDSNVLEYNNSVGVVSGSSQVVFNDTSFNPFISTSAAISASNHLIPSDNEVYDLGTPTQRWRDLYLSGSTIDLGGLLIQRSADGDVQFIDSASQATKSVTIDSITGSLTVTENLTVGGNITAQQFYTEYVTSSVIFESGSTRFGDTADDTHEFTGSLDVSGATITNNLIINTVTGNNIPYKNNATGFLIDSPLSYDPVTTIFDYTSGGGTTYFTLDENLEESRFNTDVQVTGSLDVSGSINLTSHGANGIILNADVNNGPTSGRVIFMNDSGAGYTIMNELGRLSFRSGSIPGSTSGVEKARLLSNDDFELTSGNFKVANGNGIDFSNTSDASGMTSELLDDYEEGTISGTVTGITATTNTVTGTYTKIGNLVTVHFYVVITGKSSGSGNPYLSLPFTADGTGISVGKLGGLTSLNTIISGLEYMGLYGSNGNLYAHDSSGAYIGQSSWSDGELGVTITYRAL